jgi:hypothetical protein
MSGPIRRLIHVRSRLDGRELPLVIAANSAAGRRFDDRAEGRSDAPSIVPLVFLHDRLPEATVERFLEGAFRIAARWLTTLESRVEPLLLVQPYERGNGGWLGWPTDDLFQGLAELGRDWPLERSRTALIGLGTGGTAALQLAALFPDHVSRVLAWGPWIDPAADPCLARAEPGADAAAGGLAVDDLRVTSAPITLLGNLSPERVRILPHPACDPALAVSAGPAHLRALAGSGFAPPELRPLSPPRLHARGSEVPELADELSILLGQPTSRPDGDSADDDPTRGRRDQLEPAFEHRWMPSPALARGGSVVDARFAEIDRPAFASIERTGSATVIRTSNLLGLTLKRSKSSGAVKVDGTTLKLRGSDRMDEPNGPSAAGVREVSLVRIDGRWLLAPEPHDMAADWTGSAAGLAGGLFAWRWRRLAAIVGTVGDDHERAWSEHAVRRVLETLVGGAGLPAVRTGSKTDIAWPTVTDADWLAEPPGVTPEAIPPSLIVAGRPETHLLLHQWRERLPVRWSDPEQDEDHPWFEWLGVRHAGPAEGLMLSISLPLETDAGLRSGAPADGSGSVADEFGSPRDQPPDVPVGPALLILTANGPEGWTWLVERPFPWNRSTWLTDGPALAPRSEPKSESNGAKGVRNPTRRRRARTR